MNGRPSARKLIQDALRHPTSLVFLFVVAAGLVMGYARAEPPLAGRELLLIAVLSLAYLAVGTVIFLAVLPAEAPRPKIIYLAFQIGLGLLILHLERGNGWLLMLPLASHSVALFSPGLAVLPCLLITLGIAWSTARFIPDWLTFLQSALVFGSAVIFAAVFTNISILDTRRREKIERLAKELEQANQALKAYAARVEELSVEQERSRLAREIHDGLGHYLTAMNMQAQVASSLAAVDPEGAQAALGRLQATLREALSDVRRSVAALRSDPLEGKSFLDAVQALICAQPEGSPLVEWSVTGEAHRLPAAQELTFYRAVQEGLTNVRKHAQASRVEIRLAYLPGEATLLIQDDGRGCVVDQERPGSPQAGFGLFGLRERVQLAGGEFSIRSSPGQGLSLSILFKEEHEIHPDPDRR